MDTPTPALDPLAKRAQVESQLQNLRKVSEINNDVETVKIVDELKAVLQRIDEAPVQSPASPSQTITSRTAPAILKRIRRSTLRNEPYFDSMVTIQSPAQTYRGRPPTMDKYMDGIRESQDYDAKSESVFSVEQQEEEYEEYPVYPVWIDIIPLIMLFVASAGYLVLGTYAFQFLDPGLAAKPFYEAIFVPFMTGSTVGWGFVYPTVTATRIFIMFYGLIAVPLIHALFANCGRLFCQIYCYNFAFLIPFKDPDAMPTEEQLARGVPPVSTLPASAVLNIAVIHSFIAVIVYTHYLDNLGIVESIYFNFVAIASIGFGDISPKPASMGGAIFIMIFSCSGLVVMACFLVATTLRLEHFFFEYFPTVLTEKVFNSVFFDKLHSHRSSRTSRKVQDSTDTSVVGKSKSAANHNGNGLNV